MKNLSLFVIMMVMASWVTVIAIISVQNATLVSLKFLGFASVPLPVGIVLALSVSGGMIAGAILLPYSWRN